MLGQNFSETLFAQSGMAPFPVRRFSMDEYRRLGELGVLTEEDRVELLEGWIIPKMNLNPPHSVCVQLVNDFLRKRLPAGWIVRIQDPIRTADSEPEPDLAVVRGADPRLHRPSSWP